MKDNEVRVGNWVHFFSSGENKHMPFQVKVESFGESINVFDPIPLTEDWLIKLGFNKSFDRELSHQYAYEKQGIVLSQEFILAHESEYVKYYGNALASVHQLQNLYHALTDEELKLTNK